MSSDRNPSLPPMLDISHLNEEERKIIEDVLRRHKEKEEKEQDMKRRHPIVYSSSCTMEVNDAHEDGDKVRQSEELDVQPDPEWLAQSWATL
ncbi:hypothetical protein DPMN_070756 [Dreissena polymorpha]|uniref:RabBD domain-containing protein n=1 Tax=Dreissena polymorpha TaxID=45954 RepID=A0A9D3Z6R5_DREPO|nr:hypothetical protein DPMN_070756 [Dreissena polymorpha]